MNDNDINISQTNLADSSQLSTNASSEISILPVEILVNIFGFLPFFSLMKVGNVSRAWKVISSHNLLWSPFFRKHCSHLLEYVHDQADYKPLVVKLYMIYDKWAQDIVESKITLEMILDFVEGDFQAFHRIHPELTINPELLEERRELRLQRRTLMLFAAANNHVTDFNIFKSEDAETLSFALYVATQIGHLTAVNSILKSEIPFSAENIGSTILATAINQLNDHLHAPLIEARIKCSTALLAKSPIIDAKYADVVLKVAATEGNIALVQYMLTHCTNLKAQDKGNAFLGAVKMNRVQCVKRLLEYVRDDYKILGLHFAKKIIDQSDIPGCDQQWQCFDLVLNSLISRETYEQSMNLLFAANMIDFWVFQSLFVRSYHAMFENKVIALKIALQKDRSQLFAINHLSDVLVKDTKPVTHASKIAALKELLDESELLAYFFRKNYFSAQEKGEVLVWMAENGVEGSIAELLNAKCDLTRQNERDFAATKKNDYGGYFRSLFEQATIISVEDREKALKVAAKTGHLKCVKSILQSSVIVKFTRQCLKRERIDFDIELWRAFIIPFETKRIAIVQADTNGQRQCAEYLLLSTLKALNDLTDEEKITWLIKFAIFNHYFDVLKSSNRLSYAIGYAAKIGYSQFVKVYVEQFASSEHHDCLANALMEVVKNRNFECVKYLSQCPFISLDKKGEALITAAKNGDNVSLGYLLLHNPKISKKCKNTALLEATTIDSNECVRLLSEKLLGNHDFPPISIKENEQDVSPVHSFPESYTPKYSEMVNNRLDPRSDFLIQQITESCQQLKLS